jgi:hypothetical protein
MADESYLFCIFCFLGCAIVLVAFVADRQARLEEERLSIMKAPRSVIEADLNWQFALDSWRASPARNRARRQTRGHFVPKMEL